MSDSAGAGTQVERTALAWRRTVLALVAASGLAARLATGPVGAVAWTVVVVAVAVGVVVYRSERPSPTVLVTAIVLLAAVELVAIVTAAR